LRWRSPGRRDDIRRAQRGAITAITGAGRRIAAVGWSGWWWLREWRRATIRRWLPRARSGWRHTVRWRRLRFPGITSGGAGRRTPGGGVRVMHWRVCGRCLGRWGGWRELRARGLRLLPGWPPIQRCEWGRFRRHRRRRDDRRRLRARRLAARRLA